MLHQRKMSVKTVLSTEQVNRLAQFFTLIMTIEKQMIPEKSKYKKAKKTKTADSGSLKRGPYFFLDKSCIIKLSVVLS